MKTLVVELEGTPTPGALVILSYSGTRGGRSDAKHRVGANDTRATVLAGLAAAINSEKSEWCPGSGDFKATARGETLYVQCSDRVSGVIFRGEIGDGSANLKLREIGNAS